MTTIAVIGTNYVGLVTAACLAELGHIVIGIDIDPLKVAHLRLGALPIYEPGLEAIVVDQLAAGRLRFTLDYDAGLRRAEFAFVCVGTPPAADGGADLSQVRAATTSLARHTPAGTKLVVVNKSTLPVGTGDWMQDALAEQALHPDVSFAVVSNPEFLREGSAVSDFRHPDRIVVGGDDPAAVDAVAGLYRGLDPQPPIVRTDLRTAEMIKYASNAFLATKISFINEIASICERLGADVEEVSRGMGLDRRIGPAFLHAGVGYGGSCFPKDVKALEHAATEAGATPRLLRAVMDTNHDMRELVLAKLHGELGNLKDRTIGILGLAFKANTDDVRESPAIEIARALLDEGARVRAYDPAAMAATARLLPELEPCADAYAVAEGADALLVLTEWPAFRQLDLARIRAAMRGPVLVDGRNLYAPEAMAELGFRHLSIGRGAARARSNEPAPTELRPLVLPAPTPAELALAA
jgi:UDPglucose 6-dehydrogenase